MRFNSAMAPTRAEIEPPSQRKQRSSERSVAHLQAIVDDWTERRIQKYREQAEKYAEKADLGFTPWPAGRPNFRQGSLTTAFLTVLRLREKGHLLGEELLTWCVEQKRQDAINAWFDAFVTGLGYWDLTKNVAVSLLELAARKGAFPSGHQEVSVWYMLAGGRGHHDATLAYQGNAELVDILMTHFPPRRGGVIERHFLKPEQGFASPESAALFARTAMWLHSYNHPKATVRASSMRMGL